MSTLRVRLLGTPRIECGGVALRLKYRKNIALIAYLAVTGQPHTREALITLLWPELDSSRGLANLRRNLSVLRKALGDGWLVVEGDTVSLDPGTDIRVDVDQFRGLVQAWQRHGHHESDVCPKCLRALEEGVELYQDDLLAGFTLPDSAAFDEWQFFEAEELRHELASALERLARGHSAQGANEVALPYARRWVALDPLHESAHRVLMGLYAKAGQRAAALRQYDECARILEEELGLAPSEEITALLERIRAMPGHGKDPLAAAARPRHNLPAQATPFIGREAHLAAVRRELARSDVRLLTLTGAGGTGKTRLALQVAGDALAEFHDGVFFVALAAVRDPALVMSTVAATLGIGQVGGQPALERLKEYLRDKQMLLVLDNFEQVVEAAPQASELLSGAPQLKALVTSRASLRVYGEHCYPVAPMALPEPQKALAVEELGQVEAVVLFCQRAKAVRPDFALNDENGPPVAEICTRLDGLPLAIELAAARVRLLPAQKLLSQLESRLQFLTGGARDVPARHQTLRSAIDWSHDLLDANERRLFRRLAVFAGGCTLRAAEAVANTPGDLDLIGGLEGLVDKSLLQQSQIAGEPRFAMLETIREYAAERLSEGGEKEEMQRQHACFFVELAEEAEPALHLSEMATVADRLQTEHGNLRAALAWSLDNAIGVGLRLAAALVEFWHLRAYHNEGRDWLTRVLAASGERGADQDGLRAKALTEAGKLAFFQTDYATAVALEEEALELWRRLGDDHGRARALYLLGIIAGWQVDVVKADLLSQECVTAFRRTDDRLGLARALMLCGNAAMMRGDLEAARSAYSSSTSVARDIGATSCLASAICGLGGIALVQGDHSAAQCLCEEAVALYREARNQPGLGVGLQWSATVLYSQRKYDRARAMWKESREVNRRVGHKLALGWSLCGLGWVSLHREEWHQARRLLSECLSLTRGLGPVDEVAWCLAGLAEGFRHEGRAAQAAQLLATAAATASASGYYPQALAYDIEGVAARLRAEMGETAFTAAWNEGRGRDLNAVVEQVLDDSPQ